jgi:choline dehydrogenase-like flavoprotein
MQESHIASTAGTTCHPTSTCMMGTHERAAVDSALRVHGIGGLRVIDASIMPAVVGVRQYQRGNDRDRREGRSYDPRRRPRGNHR